MDSQLVVHEDASAVGCADLAALIRAERARGVPTVSGLRSLGGWHTARFRLGTGWLGEAVRQRLARAGYSVVDGECWANILPIGSEYDRHHHYRQPRVGVWCLAGTGSLHIEPDVVVPDRPGQLVLFPGHLFHWVPKVNSERITVAINLPIAVAAQR